MSEARTYAGGCHCGAVRFEAEIDLGKPVGRCNCTLCTKRVTTGAIVKPEAFRVVAGEDAVGEYAGRSGGNQFLFCRRCGVPLFGRGDIAELGGAYVSVNVNCLDDIDPETLTVVYWDGRHDNWGAGPRPTPWPVHVASRESGG